MHLDLHGRLARDGRFDANARRSKVERDVVRQARDAANLYARKRLQLVPGDGRAAADVLQAGAHAETLQRFNQQIRVVRQSCQPLRCPLVGYLLNILPQRMLVVQGHLRNVTDQG